MEGGPLELGLVTLIEKGASEAVCVPSVTVMMMFANVPG
jgi:hypothetical protein